MANDEIILRIKTMMDNGDVKGAVSQMQSYFDKLKPSEELRGEFDKLFKDLIKEADQFETKVQGSFDKIGDVNSLKKTGDKISAIFSKITKEINKVSGTDVDLSQFFDIDTSKVTQVTKEIDQLKNKMSQITATKIESVEQSFNELLKTSKRAQGSDFFEAFKGGDLDKASADFEQLSRHLTGFGTKSDTAKEAIRNFLSLLNGGQIASARANIEGLTKFGGAAGADSKLIKYAKALVDIAEKLQQAKQETGELNSKLEQLDAHKMELIAQATQHATNEVNQFKGALNTADNGFDKLKTSANNAAASVQSFSSEVEELGSRATYFLSLENSVDLFRRGVQQAIETVKELDAAMAETAVVTDFTIGDMWDKLPEYSQMARELGVEIKGVYEASTLYYQQGLQTEQVMALTTETLKMARIAGLECADATNLMTAALRGFNMEINETSAQRVNDIYSELAAITAADTNEIATAMTKTASIASSANMELETTAALLAQMIETTREPAETAGTAMKTIVARFTEMKKAVGDIVTVEGEEVSVNKVDAALASVGVQLKDVNGEFRDLDDVLLELASKWDTLDIMSQRYIATTAAGSRQQSRFIAMMQDYDRTMELVDAAYNSSGSSAQQFDKTQESLQSTLARLSVAWDTFLMGIADDQIIKTFIKVITELLEGFNKLTEGAGGIVGSAIRIGAVFGGLRLANDAVKTLISSFLTLKGSIADGTAKLTMFQSLSQRIGNLSNGKGFLTNDGAKKKEMMVQAAANRQKTIDSAKEKVINTTNAQRAFQAKDLQEKTQRRDELKSSIDSTRQRQSALAASGRLTPKMDQNFSKEIDVASKKVQLLDGQIQRLQNAPPVDLTVLTEEARAKVQALELELESDPLNKDVEAQLEEAKLELEVFEEAEKIDDIDKVVDVDTTAADLKLEAFEKKEEADPIVKRVVTAGKEGFADKKPTNWFKGADSEFSTSLKNMKTQTTEFFQMFKKGGGGATKVAGKLGGAFAKAGGVAAKGLGGALGVLSSIPVAGWIAAAAVVAAGTAIYAAWYNSGVQVSKRLAEAQSATLQDTKENVNALNTKVQELGNTWKALEEGKTVLEGLSEGTIEWTQKIQELNGQVQELLQKYPELYQYMQVDKSTGQWTLDEAGYKAYEESQKQELNELKNRELYEQAMSNYSTTLYDAKAKSSKKDFIWNWTKSAESEEKAYKETMQRAYIEAREGAQYDNIDLSSAPDNVDDILADAKTREYITNMDNSTANANWGLLDGNADPRAVMEYYDTMSQAKQQLKAEEDAYVRNYMASQGTYGAQVQEAVAQTMYDLPSMYEQLEEDRSNEKRDRWWTTSGYDGKTGGAGAKMQGDEGNAQGRTVQQIMEDRGYELVDKNKNYYKNKYTGEYVNVDAVGGGAAGGKKKKKKVNGEEVEMETWSNEYVRDIGRQDELRRAQEQNMLKLASAFSADANLAKIGAGDLSADLSKLKDSSKKDIIGADGKTLFDYDKKVNEFEKNRAKKMDQMNQRYNNVFSSTGKKTIDSKEIKTYSQATYDAAQSTVEFEDSVKSLGDTTSQSLTATYLALQDLENPDANLNTVMDVGDSDPNAYIRDTVKALNDAGVSASNLKDYVGKIDMSSAINGARQLKNDLEAGGEEAIMAATVLGADQAGSNFFSTGNQFKELISGEQWTEKTQAGLSEIYKLEGKITADNIRELAKENSDLAAVLDTNSLKASGFAKMMEAVEDGTISLSDVTSDLIELYDDLYYTADLAGEAIARLESVEIGKSDTEIGKIYSEAWAATQDLIDRGAYGDSQIDDYMNQMVGEATWTDALAAAGGDKTKARAAIDKEYGLSENEGNLYGSWKAQMKENNGSIADGAITMGSDGKINYDLSKVNSTEELIGKMMKDMGVTKEYAETMLADMKTYSKTFGSDLDDLDKRGALDDFLDSRTTKDGVLNISAAEKAAFAKARGQSVDEFEADLKNMKGADGKPAIKSFEDRKYSESGYYHSSTDEEGNKTVKFTDDTAKQEVISQAKEAMVDMEGAEIPVKITTEDGEVLNPDLLNSMIGVDSVREIMLDPNLSEEEKLSMLQEIETGMYGSTANGLAEGLLGETSMTNAQNYSNYMGDEIYNKMGGALQEAMNLLAAYEVFVPMDFKLPIGIPAIEIAGVKITDGFTVAAVSTSGAGITIGGESASMTPVGGGTGFTPRNNKYTPQTVDVDPGNGGGTGGGTGSSYEKGDDEDNTGNSGNGSSGSKAENDTDPRVANMDKKLEALDRKLTRREINAVDYEFEKRELNREKQQALQAQLKAEEKEADFLNEYYRYDEETDTYLYLEDAYNKASDETKNKIDEEINKLITINDQLNDIEDAIEDFEFKDDADEASYYAAEASKLNAEKDLEHIERQRGYDSRYGEIVGKLPSEIQGPLNLALTGTEMYREAQEISVNQGIKADLEAQMRAKYNDSDLYGKYYAWDERTQSFKLNEEEFAKIEHDQKTRDAILEEYNAMEDYAAQWREVSDELYGGVLQDAMKGASKALKQFSSEVADNDFDNHLIEINTGFEKLDKALNEWIDSLSGNEKIEEILNKKIIPGLGWGDEELNKILQNEKLVNFLGESGLGPLVSEMGWGEGVSVGQLASFGSGLIGDALGGAADLFNFDMILGGLDMINGVKSMFDQGQQMIEKIVGYITQATQVIVDAWTNREDYLYNFLKIIEKHLQEYEKLQREDNQFQKGRTASVEDIKRNWNEQWESLQTQLEEQQERLETRQQELDRSRWNPFSLISGWDPTSDTLYENREVKMLWDIIIGLGEAFAPFGTGAFFSQLNQLYEDYDQRVQNSYEDRLAAEQAILDIEDQRLDLVKAGSQEATDFEQRVLDALIQKEQEQIDELTRLNDAITEANQKLMETLQNNLEKIRQDRENEKKEEELGEKERRLAYLRQDTSGANLLEIKKLEEELEEGHEDYTDTLIDQKISELEKQNEEAAEQRQQQIDLLQAQLDWSEKYGLYWDAIYGMLYTIDENGNAVLNPENFDTDGNIRENSELAKMLGTFSDRMGMSTWSAVLDAEELKLLGKYYGAFIGVNGVEGKWKNQWALDDPGADDPNYATPEQEIPDGIWGVLYRLEIGMKKYFVNSNLGLANGIGRVDESFKNFFGKLFGNEEWANYDFTGYEPQEMESTFFAGLKKIGDDTKEWIMNGFGKVAENSKGGVNVGGTQKYGAVTENYNFNIGTVGENISLDDMVDRVSSAIRGLFTLDGVGGTKHGH